LDDVIVVGSPFRKAQFNLRQVFQRSRQARSKFRKKSGTWGILYRLKEYPPTPEIESRTGMSYSEEHE
jgi:hypothetical protein